MKARQKLNAAFFNGSLLLAGLIGLLTGSWLVFGISLILLVGVQFANGDIRGSGQR